MNTLFAQYNHVYGQTIYAKFEGMSQETVTTMLENMGCTNVVFVSEEVYLNSLPEPE